MILDGIIRAVVNQELKGILHGRKAQKVGDDLTAVVKAALVDMDYAISVYLDALADERARLEEQRAREKEEQDQALSALETVLARLAGGDLTSELNEALAPSFRGLKDNFNSSVAALDRAMQEIASSVDQVRCEAAGIASAANEIAKRTEHQASALEESAAALEQITTIAGQSTQRAQEVQTVVRESTVETNRSGEVVKQAVAAMGDIESSSQKMTQIIGVIDEIAFQTNLLALNAGVEARQGVRCCRAGGAGTRATFGWGRKRDQRVDQPLVVRRASRRPAGQRDGSFVITHWRSCGFDQQQHQLDGSVGPGTGVRD